MATGTGTDTGMGLERGSVSCCGREVLNGDVGGLGGGTSWRSGGRRGAMRLEVPT